MITLNEFIERSKPAWQAARGYIQCFDNPNDPTEFKLGPNDWYWKNKISNMLQYALLWLCRFLCY